MGGTTPTQVTDMHSQAYRAIAMFTYTYTWENRGEALNELVIRHANPAPHPIVDHARLAIYTSGRVYCRRPIVVGGLVRPLVPNDMKDCSPSMTKFGTKRGSDE